MWGCVGGGGGGGVAHLEGEALVFVDEEVGAGEGEVVGEVCVILVDVVAVWGRLARSSSCGSQASQDLPENMSSLNSLHPFSNFSTSGQVREVLYLRRIINWLLTTLFDVLVPDGLLFLFDVLGTLDERSHEIFRLLHGALLEQSVL